MDDDVESVEGEESLSGYYTKASGGGLGPHSSWQGEHIEPGSSIFFSLTPNHT